MFGDLVVVQVVAHSDGEYHVQNITVPSLQEGEVECSDVSKNRLKRQL